MIKRWKRLAVMFWCSVVLCANIGLEQVVWVQAAEDVSMPEKRQEESGTLENEEMHKTEDENTVGVNSGSLEEDASHTEEKGTEKLTVSERATSLGMKPGETAVLTVDIIPDGLTSSDIIWSSSNEAVATVEGGTVRAVAEGNCTISTYVGKGYGTLDSWIVHVNDFGEIKQIAGGSYGGITWAIDGNGKLTVEGTGNVRENNGSLGTIPWYAYRSKLLSAKVRITGMTDASELFSGCSFLTEIDFSEFDTSNVTDMNNMFYCCDSLKNLDISYFDTNEVTNMSRMFSGCVSLARLDLSKFSTVEVTDMSYMFHMCNSLSNLDISGFDTKKVSDMSGMFHGCGSLTELNMNNLSVTEVTSMTRMFYNCSRLTSLNIGNFKTEKATDMAGMFSGCSSLTNLDLGSFETENVTNMSSMFANCSSLTNLDLGSFKTENVTDMSSMFSGCSSLSNLNLSSLQTGKVTNIGYMFRNCNSLTSIDVSNFDMTSITFMGWMFDGCDSLTDLDLSGFDMGKVMYTPNGIIHTSCIINRCNSLIRILSPINVKIPVLLPSGTWRKADGTVVTELPKDQAESLLLTKDEEIPTPGYPCITAEKVKTSYICGDVLNLDDLTVTYYTTAESGNLVIDFTTNAATIDMSTPGQKILEVTYNGLKAYISLTVLQKEEPPAATYNVMFNLQGRGNALPEYSSFEYTDLAKGSIIKEPPAPTANGYIFTGWYKDPECTERWDFTQDVIDADITLYAGWREISVYDDGVLPEDEPSNGKFPDGLWIAGIEKYTYTGAAVMPQVRVYYHDKRLIKGRDYTVSYKNNKKAWDSSSQTKKVPTVIVKGTGNYVGTVSQTFTIHQAELTPDCLIASSDYLAGSAYAPAVMLAGNILKVKTDYTVTYYHEGKKLKKQPVTEGNYSMQITGKGSCIGDFLFSYAIVKDGRISVSKGKAVVSNMVYGEKEPAVSLTVGGKYLTPGTDYTVRFANIGARGTATAVFTGTGKYTGVLKKTFKVKAVPLPKESVFVAPSAPYEKGGARAEVTVMVNDTKLIEGIDYTISYKGNAKFGNIATAIVKGKGNYSGSQSGSFKVTAKDLSAEGVRVYVSDAITGKKPAVMIYDTNGRKMSSGSDYTVKVDRATHKVTIMGGKNQLYTVSAPITEDYQELEAGKVITSVFLNKRAEGFPGKFQYAMNGVELDKNWLIVKAGKNVLSAENFEVVGYINNVSKGTATIIIQGSGAYGGTKALNFKIQSRNVLSIF